MSQQVRIGTRGSALALWQAEHVRDRLEALGHEVEIRVITTTGDRVLDRRLETVGGKGAFLKEIEEALLAGEVDLAVHSPQGRAHGAARGPRARARSSSAPTRATRCSPRGARLAELPAGARVGHDQPAAPGARSRALRPDLVLVDLRGNVDTRIRRLREGRFDAILLAMAGLVRLGRAGEVTEALDPRAFLPAPGQGAIALECRDGDARRAPRPSRRSTTRRPRAP